MPDDTAKEEKVNPNLKLSEALMLVSAIVSLESAVHNILTTMQASEASTQAAKDVASSAAHLRRLFAALDKRLPK